MLTVIRGMLPDNHRDSAYRQYKNIVTALAPDRRLLEIGAGRRPLLTPEEIKARNIRYTANDIIAERLDLIPFPSRRWCSTAAVGFLPSARAALM